MGSAHRGLIIRTGSLSRWRARLLSTASDRPTVPSRFLALSQALVCRRFMPPRTDAGSSAGGTSPPRDTRGLVGQGHGNDQARPLAAQPDDRWCVLSTTILAPRCRSGAIHPSFDDLVGAREDQGREGETQSFHGLHIDHQLELGRSDGSHTRPGYSYCECQQ